MNDTESAFHRLRCGEFYFDGLSGLHFLSVFIIESNVNGLCPGLCVFGQLQFFSGLFPHLCQLLFCQLDKLDFHIGTGIKGAGRSFDVHVHAVSIQVIGCILLSLHQIDVDPAVTEDFGLYLSVTAFCGVVDIDMTVSVCDRTDLFNHIIADCDVLKSITLDFRNILRRDPARRKISDRILGRKLITQIQIKSAARNLCLSLGSNADVREIVQFKACAG